MIFWNFMVPANLPWITRLCRKIAWAMPDMQQFAPDQVLQSRGSELVRDRWLHINNMKKLNSWVKTSGAAGGDVDMTHKGRLNVCREFNRRVLSVAPAGWWPAWQLDYCVPEGEPIRRE